MGKVRDTKHISAEASDEADRADEHQALDRATHSVRELLIDLGRLQPLRDPIGALRHHLTPSQFHAVLWLGVEGALAQNVIAQRLGCAQPTLTGIVDRLEKLGLVERERATDDRRVVRVKLTDNGTQAYREFDTTFCDRLKGLLSLIPPKDRQQLVRIIADVVGVLRGLATDKSTEDL